MHVVEQVEERMAALRLVCAREAEIEDFVPQEYWTVEAVVATEPGARFAARLRPAGRGGVAGGQGSPGSPGRAMR